MLEKIQRRATKLIPELRDLWTDNTRNAKIKGDQLQVFKILNGYMKILILIFFFESKITSGHNFTLMNKQSRLDV